MPDLTYDRAFALLRDAKADADAARPQDRLSCLKRWWALRGIVRAKAQREYRAVPVGDGAWEETL